MSDLPPFLRMLELGTEADERAIRRAYAKRLKLIDPETDPAAFQGLRETFEAALKWAAWQAERVRQHDALATPPTTDETLPAVVIASQLQTPQAPAEAPPPAPQQSLAHRAGDEVFAAFLTRFRAGVASAEDVVAQLKEALADTRLVNLEAHRFFEWRMACLIMEGWQPGHEFLFKPACDAFGWAADRRGLELFGRLGAALDAAIRERAIFFDQSAGAFELQRKVIRRMRGDKPTSLDDLVSEIPMLSMLLQRYPNWMRTMSRRDVVQHWIDSWNALTPQQREAHARSQEVGRRRMQAAAAPPVAPPPPFKPKMRLGGAAAIAWVLMMLLGAIGHMLSGSSTSQAAYAPPVPPPPAWARPAPAAARSTHAQDAYDFPSSYAGGLTSPSGSIQFYPEVHPAKPVADTRSQATRRAREAADQRVLQDLAKQYSVAPPLSPPSVASPSPSELPALAASRRYELIPDAAAATTSAILGRTYGPASDRPGQPTQVRPSTGLQPSVDYRLATPSAGDGPHGFAVPPRPVPTSSPSP